MKEAAEKWQLEQESCLKRIAAAESKVKVSEAAFDEIQAYMRTKESDLSMLRVEAQQMKTSFETLVQAVEDKDKRIRIYAKRLHEEVNAERSASDLRAEEVKLATERTVDLRWSERLAARELELRNEYEDKVSFLNAESQERLKDMIKRYEQSSERLKEEVAKKIKQTLTEVTLRHEEEMEKQIEQERVTARALLRRVEEGYNAQLEELREKQHLRAEERVRELRELWEDELFDANKAKDVEIQMEIAEALRKAGLEAEAEKQTSLQLEASKWQMLMTETESKMEMALQYARTSGWDERDKTAKETIATMQKTIDSLSKRSSDSYDEVAELVTKYEAKIQTLQIEHERAMAMNVMSAATAMKEKMETLASKQLQEAEDLTEKKLAALQSKLKREELALNQLRDDFSAQTSRSAAEKGILLERVAVLEDREVQLREVHASEKVYGFI